MQGDFLSFKKKKNYSFWETTTGHGFLSGLCQTCILLAQAAGAAPLARPQGHSTHGAGERPGPRVCQQMHKVTSAPSAAGRIGVCLRKRLVGKQRRHLRVSREGTRRANLPSRALNHNMLAGIRLVPSSLQVSALGCCAAGSGSSALPPGPGCSWIWGTAAQQILTASRISSAGLAPRFFQGMNSRCMYPKLSICTQSL